MENLINYPKTWYISENRPQVKIDIKDPNFDKPLSNLEKTYERPTAILRVEDYGEFEIITLSPC